MIGSTIRKWFLTVWPRGAHAAVLAQYQDLREKPELLADIALRGGIWNARPPSAAAPNDALRLAYEQGRRSLAIEIVQLARMDPDRLNRIVNSNLANRSTPND